MHACCLAPATNSLESLTMLTRLKSTRILLKSLLANLVKSQTHPAVLIAHPFPLPNNQLLFHWYYIGTFTAQALRLLKTTPE